jgi:SAM-dependent methyltransferase
MNVLNWALQSSREKGVVKTVKIACNVVMDLRFDWKYGTDTMRWVDRNELETESDNRSHSAPYRATKVGPLLQLLDRLHLPRDCNFLDIGSGKGRVLLIASQYGFRKVVGIEFSPELCAIARKNVEVFCRKAKPLSSIEVIETDATKYAFQAEDRVFFMYNPFDGFILGKVLDNIRHSLEENPRRIWLIYNTPLYHEIIKAAGLFQSDSFYEIGGNYFRVYTKEAVRLAKI